MGSCRQSWVMLIAVCLIMACAGCQNGETASGLSQPDRQPDNGVAGQNTAKGGSNTGGPVGTNSDPEPLLPPTIPRVALAEKDRQTCRKQVNEMMPDAELPDLEGQVRPLAGLRGEKMTVVCFWRSGESLRGELEAVETLGDLQGFSDDYYEKGVQVIGINVGDRPEMVRKRVADAEAMFPNLLDLRGDFFSQVATEKLPRVYLLDAEGRILWFDLEFSRTTRRNLKQGIQVHLGEL